MAALTPDQILQLATITSIPALMGFINTNLGIFLTNAIVLNTLTHEFSFGTITYTYDYDPPNNNYHQFWYDSTMEVPPEEEQQDPPNEKDLSLRNEFVAQILIRFKDKVGEQQGIFGGLIQIPIGTGKDGTLDGSSEFLEFKLAFQNKKSPGQAESSSIIVGSLSAQEDLQVYLGDLISEISPGLSKLIPVELLSYFRVGGSIIVVIDCSADPPNPSVSPSGAIRNKGGSHNDDEFNPGGGTVDMVLKDGSLGVGTDNPSYKLDVNGTAHLGGDTEITGDTEIQGSLAVGGRIKDKTGYVIPVGTVVPYAGSSAPEGWLMCDGSSFNTTKYPELRAVLGKDTVPNLQNRFITGAGGDYTLNKTGGTKQVTLSTDNLPRHDHASSSYDRLVRAIEDNTTSRSTDENDTTGTEPDITHSGAIQEVGKSEPFDILPPYYALNYIIKC